MGRKKIKPLVLRVIEKVQLQIEEQLAGMRHQESKIERMGSKIDELQEKLRATVLEVDRQRNMICHQQFLLQQHYLMHLKSSGSARVSRRV